MADIKNVLQIIAEIFIVIVRFWYAVAYAIYAAFNVQEKDVSGEIVLITGAGHGIGKEMALQYSQLDATIICWDINEQLNLDTVNLIKSKGKKAYGFTIDVTNREKVIETGRRVLSEVGTVTILIQNAGIMPQHLLLQHTEKEIRSTFELNVLAQFWILEAFLPKMIEINRGHVVSISSMAGLIGSRNLVPYCASKFAVRGLMEALGEEIRAESQDKSQIKFTTIYPYAIATGLFKEFKARFPKMMPVLEPKEAAAQIIKAQRIGLQEVSIPRELRHTNNVFRLFPSTASKVINDFLKAYVVSDK